MRDGKTHFPLELQARESILFLLDEKGDVPTASKRERIYVPVRFTLVSDDETSFVKTYAGEFTVDETKNNEFWIRVTAEEMVECFVNDRFVDVSLWNEHRFRIAEHIRPGANRVVLRVTGNAANRFTEHRIAYGLTEV